MKGPMSCLHPSLTGPCPLPVSLPASVSPPWPEAGPSTLAKPRGQAAPLRAGAARGLAASLSVDWSSGVPRQAQAGSAAVWSLEGR